MSNRQQIGVGKVELANQANRKIVKSERNDGKTKPKFNQKLIAIARNECLE